MIALEKVTLNFVQKLVDLVLIVISLAIGLDSI